ncbi:hypothetical protein [Providencia sp. PROV236]|uniref:hypothetical protein n=1 Tax=Providencia sp. PROV236 TaxID=2936798 RepID=UPI0034E2FA5E
MKKEQSFGEYEYLTGYCDFENYWGEELIEVEFTHFVSGLIDQSEVYGTSKIIHNVPDKTKITDAFVFRYAVGPWDRYDYWTIKIHTKSGKMYQSKRRFYCSLGEQDDGRVILGVNGDAKTFYVAFPVSSGCNTELNEIN